MNQERNNIPHYSIGTRGSLLALTQCLQMKALMEKSGEATFSLKVIKTQGDENTQAPLWALDGKDFFTKELDHALLAGEVDLVVHSYKDLGSERPDGITLATITERKFAHDILFIRKEVIDSLKNKKLKNIVVGTSSPRRMENITAKLADYLPYGDQTGLSVETKSLRGNVNTRLEKCVKGDYDAIVLALPGIERLAQGLENENNEAYERHGNPKTILKELIKELDYMVLPLGEFPAAASQGALAVECLAHRSDGGSLLNFLNKFNHQKTIHEVKEERRLFQTFGGGCHLAVGISVSHGDFGLRRSLAGAVDNKKIKELSLVREKPLPDFKGEAFIGLPQVDSFQKAHPDRLTEKEPVPTGLPNAKTLCQQGTDVLITSPSVVDMAENLYEELYNKNISWWAAGTKTMKKMAARGLWVRGCADSLGEGHLKNLRQSHLLQLFSKSAGWLSLSHDKATSTLGTVVGLYEKTYDLDDKDDTYRGAIENCGLYYWTSTSQYQKFNEIFNLNPQAIHACGLGKTMVGLKSLGLEPIGISSMAELKSWVNS